jgi:hypothetical protein
MPYHIFMSYSASDRPWVEWLANHASTIGIATYLFDHDPQPGRDIANKVKQQIEQSDALVVFLTANSRSSAYVHQEIGFAEASKKIIIPLVQPGIDNCLAMLTGREYIEFNFLNPQAAVQPFLTALYN